MPPNSKNNKLSFKESSVSTNEVEALETQETIEPKSKKMSKIVPNEDMPQKGAGKVKITKEAEVEIEASEPPKIKGKGKASVVKVEEPVKEEPIEEPVKVKSKGKGKAKDDVKEVEVEVEKVLVKKTNGSKSKAENTTKATKATKANKANKDNETTAKEVEGKTENETTVEGETDIDKYVRSFKVLLPGNQEFIGRYTGLTPYQAANKALSKFFRENKNIKTTNNEITFSIRESTRGSKRSTYTYNGTREKLENPVKYSINGLDGNAREIIKEYKNKLTKVKKSESDVLVNETTTSS
jgi:hypothetical protein